MPGRVRRRHARVERLDNTSAISPNMSICSCSYAALPTRTGEDCSYPASQGTFNSGNQRSPPTPYMICTWSGLPATARIEPISPGARFLIIAELHEGLQGEGGVAQPAIAVIPVPVPTEVLRQRCCNSGDNSARRRIGQGLQGYERALDHSARTRLRDSGAPFPPPGFRSLQRREASIGGGRTL